MQQNHKYEKHSVKHMLLYFIFCYLYTRTNMNITSAHTFPLVIADITSSEIGLELFSPLEFRFILKVHLPSPMVHWRTYMQ